MKHRAVVSNYIFKWVNPDQTNQLVALFKRSTHKNVRSYQGKYSPIAGSIDKDDLNPLAAAEREIHEETQLVPGQDLSLEYTGKSFTFEDEQAQRSWTVYPFGWVLLANESKIEIDWEHSGWQWFEPQTVLDGSIDSECVPRLTASLQRVYFGPGGMFKGIAPLIDRTTLTGKTFLNTIDKLKKDTENGARVLATEALRGLQQILESFEPTAVEVKMSGEHWHALRVVAYHLINSSRPSMNAAIAAAVIAALTEVDEGLHQNRFSLQQAIEVFQVRIARRPQSSDKIAAAFESCLRRDIKLTDKTGTAAMTINLITLSSSSTISAALKRLLADKTLKLTLLIFESRASCEGATLAASLIDYIKNQQPKGAEFHVKIAPESHMSSLLLRDPSTTNSNPSRTYIVLGADRITPSGHVVNKVGSAPLALLSKIMPGNEMRSTVVLSEEDKIAVPDELSLAAYADIADTNSTQAASDNKEVLLAELAQKELNTSPNESHPPGEVTAAWTEKARQTLEPFLDTESRCAASDIQVEVENRYFEIVPTSDIDTYLSENGELDRKDIMTKSLARARAADALFGSLYD